MSRAAFSTAHDVSSYSLAALARGARPLMQGRRAALLTLTYLGALRALPNYNVMGLAKASLEANVRYLAAALGPEGIRVNGISAGPIKTLAAAGIVALGTNYQESRRVDEHGNEFKLRALSWFRSGAAIRPRHYYDVYLRVAVD